MNIKRRLSSGDLMLLELVFAIIFFSLAIAASMSVFGNAYEMSHVAESRSQAVRETDSAAEVIRSSETKEEMESLLTGNGFGIKGNGCYEKLFGNDAYRLIINVSESERLINADMRCFYTKDSASYSSSEPFYDLTIQHAVKGGS